MSYVNFIGFDGHSRLIAFLLISIWFNASLAGASEPVTVATYNYKDIDRERAIQPLANVIRSISKKDVNIEVLSSPSDLAYAFTQDTADIIVPNLTGYAMAAAFTDNFHYLFVPDNQGSTYSSSIVTALSKSDFAKKLQQNALKIGMVWPDSTSGAILGEHYLESQLNDNKIQRPLNGVEYLGSHSDVLKALNAGAIELGVLATDVFVRGKKSQGLIEIWRSELIPFGPVICSVNIRALCKKISETVLSDPAVSETILNGFKEGWVEFEHSSRLISPNLSQYDAFVAHWKDKMNEE